MQYTVTIPVKFTSAQKKRLITLAKKRGVPTSTLIRQQVLETLNDVSVKKRPTSSRGLIGLWGKSRQSSVSLQHSANKLWTKEQKTTS